MTHRTRHGLAWIRGPLAVGAVILAGLAVGIPAYLGMGTLAELGLALVVMLAASAYAVGIPHLGPWAIHLTCGVGLGTIGYAVFGVGWAPVLVVYASSLVLLAVAQALGTRAAFGWTVPCLVLVAASAFLAPVHPQPVPAALAFVVRALTVLAILGFAISFRRERDRQAAELERRAVTDGMTGLANRQALRRALDDTFARCKRYGRISGVVYIDLDGLKAVNDSLGHAAGDRMILTCAERIRRVTRRVDTVARVGGDEFVVVLSELADARSCGVFARKLLRELEEPVELPGGPVSVSASLGLAVIDGKTRDAESALKAADAAMYAAKRAGGDRIYADTPDGPMAIEG